jgi:Cu/Ag efflux protein CusF
MRSMLGIARSSRAAVVAAAMLIGCVGMVNAAAAAPQAKAAKADNKKHSASHKVSGVIEKVDEAGKTIVVKTAAGGEETFEVGKGATLKGMKEGAKVTVQYSEEGGKKIAHALKHG